MPPKTKSNADARARAQAKREAMRRAERNRRRGFLALWGTLGLVVVLVVVLAVVFTVGHNNDTKSVTAPASPALVQDLVVPEAALASAGTSGLGSRVVGLTPITGGDPITTDGKPTVVYVGGEFCPYCAAQRWALAVALDRFGTFTGLQTTRSAADDGNYATLTFVGSTYTSQYVSFDGKEIYDRAKKTIKSQTLDAAAAASYKKYGQVGSVPYFTVNNQYKGTVQFNPSDLGTKSADAIAAEISAGQTSLAKDVLASANIITAAICKATNGQPAAVCSAAEVTAAATSGLTASAGGSTSHG